MATAEQLQSRAVNAYLDALQEFARQYTEGLITFSELVGAVGEKTYQAGPLANAMHHADQARQDIRAAAKCYLGPDA